MRRATWSRGSGEPHQGVEAWPRWHTPGRRAEVPYRGGPERRGTARLQGSLPERWDRAPRAMRVVDPAARGASSPERPARTGLPSRIRGRRGCRSGLRRVCCVPGRLVRRSARLRPERGGPLGRSLRDAWRDVLRPHASDWPRPRRPGCRGDLRAPSEPKPPVRFAFRRTAPTREGWLPTPRCRLGKVPVVGEVAVFCCPIA